MIKIFLPVLIFILLISGCSKENKNSSSEIKIEQQNPAPQKPVDEASGEIKIEPDPKINTDTSTTEPIADHHSKSPQVPKEENLTLNSKQTSKYIGKNATVTGYIADVFKNEKVAYLNFDAKFPKNTCAAVIFKDDFGKFGDVKKFKNKTITVSGIISEYNGKPQIILKSSSQVKITD